MSRTARMETVEFENTLKNINEKVTAVKSLFDDIEKSMATLDGTNKIWQGRAQELVYKNYSSIANKFPGIKEKLEDYVEFLSTTLDYYKQEENSLENSVNNNADDLNIV